MWGVGISEGECIIDYFSFLAGLVLLPAEL